MKAIHWRIKVSYNFEKKVNQNVNLGRCPMAGPDIAILKDGFFKNLSKNENWKVGFKTSKFCITIIIFIIYYGETDLLT